MHACIIHAAATNVIIIILCLLYAIFLLFCLLCAISNAFLWQSPLFSIYAIFFLTNTLQLSNHALHYNLWLVLFCLFIVFPSSLTSNCKSSYIKRAIVSPYACGLLLLLMMVIIFFNPLVLFHRTRAVRARIFKIEEKKTNLEILLLLLLLCWAAVSH